MYDTVLQAVKSDIGSKVHSEVFPTLLTRTSSLSYGQMPTNSKHIGSSIFKTQINLITVNATEMLKEMGNVNLTDAEKSQNQAPAEIKSRLFPIAPNLLITSEKHDSVVEEYRCQHKRRGRIGSKGAMCVRDNCWYPCWEDY